MNFIWAILVLSIFANDCLAKKKKLDLDFEFVDKVIHTVLFYLSLSLFSFIRLNLSTTIFLFNSVR